MVINHRVIIQYICIVEMLILIVLFFKMFPYIFQKIFNSAAPHIASDEQNSAEQICGMNDQVVTLDTERVYHNQVISPIEVTDR